MVGILGKIICAVSMTQRQFISHKITDRAKELVKNFFGLEHCYGTPGYAQKDYYTNGEFERLIVQIGGTLYVCHFYTTGNYKRFVITRLNELTKHLPEPSEIDDYTDAVIEYRQPIGAPQTEELYI